MFDIITMGIFLGALALLIMSAIIHASAKKLSDTSKISGDVEVSQKVTDIKRTAMILLIVSLAVTGMYGYKLFGQYQAHKAMSSVASFSYYF